MANYTKIGVTSDATAGTQDTTQTAPQLAIDGQQVPVTKPPSNGNDVTTALTKETLDFFASTGRDEQLLEVDEKNSANHSATKPPKDHRASIDSGLSGAEPSEPSQLRRAGARAGGVPTLAGRVRREPKLKLAEERSPGHKAFGYTLAALGFIGGAIGGAFAGAAAAAAIGSTTFIGVPVAPIASAAVLAGSVALGGYAGWKGGFALADKLWGHPQGAHAKEAIRQLRADRGEEFTEAEVRNLGRLEDDKGKLGARTLLHVPSGKAFHVRILGKDIGAKRAARTRRSRGQVKDRDRRQKIRQAVLRNFAVTGDFEAAKNLKTRLIAAANNENPTELDRKIAEDRLHTIRDRLGLQAGDLPLGAEESLVAQLSDPAMTRSEEKVSETLVELAAGKAANPERDTDEKREADARAVRAVAAHAAQYKSADFMVRRFPGDHSLQQIFDRYAEGFVASTVNAVKKDGAEMKSTDWEDPTRNSASIRNRTTRADALFTDTMTAIVGSSKLTKGEPPNDEEAEVAAGKVPAHFAWLVKQMVETAAKHAADADKERVRRGAAFYGLLGRNLRGDLGLPKARGVWPDTETEFDDFLNAGYSEGAENLARNERLVRDTFVHGDITPVPMLLSNDHKEQVRNEARVEIQRRKDKWAPAVDTFVRSLLDNARPVASGALGAIDSSIEEQ